MEVNSQKVSLKLQLFGGREVFLPFSQMPSKWNSDVKKKST